MAASANATENANDARIATIQTVIPATNGNRANAKLARTERTPDPTVCQKASRNCQPNFSEAQMPIAAHASKTAFLPYVPFSWNEFVTFVTTARNFFEHPFAATR